MDSFFLKDLVENLASITKVKYVLIASAKAQDGPDFVETITLWSHGKFVENIQFAVSDTPCKEVMDGNTRFYPKGVQELFPEDEELKSMDAEGYLGCPIVSSSGQSLGYVCILDTKPLENEKELTTSVQAFASMASSEFERNQEDLRKLSTRRKEHELREAELIILEMIAQNKPQKEIFTQLCLTMEAQASSKAFASVLLVKEDVTCLQLGAAPSFNKQVQEALDGLTIDECSGSCAAAVFRKSPVFVTDVQTDPLWAKFREFAKDQHIEACWSMPFLSESGDVLGSFALTHSIIVEPTESDIRLMKVAAHLACITVEKFKTQQALSSSEEKFTRALEISPDGVVITRVADGKIIDANDACIKMTGYSRKELIGKTTLELNIYSAKERDRVVSLLKKDGVYAEFESTLQRKDGKVLNTLSSGAIFENNGEPCIFAIVHDVTDRKKIEDELKQSEEKLRTAFKTSPDAMMITKLHDGECIDVNEGFVRLSGISKEDALGHSPLALGIWPDKVEREKYKNAIVDNGYVNNYETEIRHSDGALIPVILAANLIDIDGEQFVFTIAKDVSELKQSRLLLEESNWMLEIEKKALEQISLNIEPDKILMELIYSIETRYPDLYCAMSLLDDEGQYLSCYVTTPRLPEEYKKDIGKLRIGQSVGSCGTAAYCNKTVFVSDIATDPLWDGHRRMAEKYGLRACWSIPVSWNTGEVAGTIAIYYKEPKAADEKHIQVLERLRKIAEICIEQNKAKNELQQSEEKFRSAFGKAPIVVTLVDKNGMVLQSNEKANSLLGYTEEEIVGRSIGEFTHSEDLQRSMKMYQLLVNGEVNHYEIEKRYVAKSGDIVWAQLNISSVRDEDQNFLYAIAHNLDITERKKSEVVLFERTEEESVFANLLKFSFLPIEEYMNLSLEEILSVSWIKIEDKGGIFLTREQGDSETLQLVANIRIPDELLRLCNNVEFGTCLCGRAAESMQVQFADCVDERHETRYQGMAAHGHYNVPIINDGKVLGVIVLYLAAGHQSQQKEINFLKRVADVLSLGLARKYAEERINYQAAHDSLTGLISRREFETRLMNVLTLSDSSSAHALCYLDLDQFKVINDDCGHLAGDELLHQLATLLQSKVRKRDTLARLGGDEFGLLMEHCSIGEAMRVADSLRVAVEEFRFVWEKKNFSLGVSIGLVPIVSGKSDVKSVLGAADAACYAAKDAGRNRVHIYNPEDVDLAQRRGEMKWVTKIKDAIDEDRMRLYIQPIVPLLKKGEDEKTRHYECLIRMIDEDGKIVPPGAFLPAAERYDLSIRIDQWVFDAAYAWLEKRPGKAKGLTSCSVNLSGHSLSNDEFLRHIVGKLEKGTVLPSSFCFEITETVAVAKLSNAIRFMEVLRSIGCYFALDDFGSGVSSFGYLKNLPVDFLKIDGMFIRDMVNDPIDLEMVRSINEIGHVMGKKTIAEFVENEEILQCLKKLGVDYAQGFHVGKPRAIKVPAVKASRPKVAKKKARKKKRVVRTRKTD
ncbi:MAG: hypothetical protein DRQ48_01550 [Gammaproteobacteria bacterium]|nr:MAG: hypothetical protein DRQ48_01550 [Gammaproteobacteria bacterium]